MLFVLEVDHLLQGVVTQCGIHRVEPSQQVSLVNRHENQ